MTADSGPPRVEEDVEMVEATVALLAEEVRDDDKQKVAPVPPQTESETSTQTQTFWLLIWMTK
jgi:hypothetical protein